MSATATPIGATAPPVSYPQPGTGRQARMGVAPRYCAEREAEASGGRGENVAVGG